MSSFWTKFIKVDTDYSVTNKIKLFRLLSDIEIQITAIRIMNELLEFAYCEDHLITDLFYYCVIMHYNFLNAYTILKDINATLIWNWCLSVRYTNLKYITIRNLLELVVTCRVTWRAPLLERKLLILPETSFLWRSYCSIYSFHHYRFKWNSLPYYLHPH